MKATDSKASQCRSELKELTEALLRLETLDIDAGTATLYRFIGERISEIAQYLCDLVAEDAQPLYC